MQNTTSNKYRTQTTHTHRTHNTHVYIACMHTYTHNTHTFRVSISSQSHAFPCGHPSSTRPAEETRVPTDTRPTPTPPLRTRPGTHTPTSPRVGDLQWDGTRGPSSPPRVTVTSHKFGLGPTLERVESTPRGLRGHPCHRFDAGVESVQSGQSRPWTRGSGRRGRTPHRPSRE